MSSVYIIDGSGYIFRAYYAILQPLSTKSGLPTNALYGFTKMLLSFLDKVTKQSDTSPVIYVVFDAARKNFRHDLYPDYKANRAECPEDLVPQMPFFPKIASAMGFHVLLKEGFEADDIIATIIKQYLKESLIQDLTIVSADKDLTQLVNSQVTMWDPMRDRIFNESEVEKHFGVKPKQIRDYLSIVGDSSDNVPGAKGIGPKTVAQLFQNFDNLDDLLANLDKVSQVNGLRGATSVQNKLESNLDAIRLSYKLVTLDENVPLELSHTNWNGFSEQELRELISELEFQSLFQKFSINNISKVKDYSNKNYKQINLEELRALISSNQIKEIGIDTETDSINPRQANVVGVSISWQANSGYYIPVSNQNLNELKEVLELIVLRSDVLKYGSNLKFDLAVLSNVGIEVSQPFFDTVIASQILNPEARGHGLKNLAKNLLNEEMVSYEEMMEGVSHISEVPLEKLTNYAAHDADASFQIGHILRERFSAKENEKLKTLFENIEMPLVSVLKSMEDRGIKIDVEKLENLEHEFSDELDNLRHNIVTHAGEDFNVNSPKQLAVILFEKLGLNTFGIKKNQNGYSTDSNALAKLQGSHPIISDLIEYREIHKLLTTYVQSLKNLINHKTQRIHTTFNQAITATGRLSSSDPNLQNIPIRSARGKKIRDLFISDLRKSFIIADYSQIELRVLAHLSEDKNLISAFQSGEDIHLRTARELFGDMFALGSTASHYRRIAKTINFGIIYGMGAFRLANDLGVSRTEAQSFIDAYFSRYPKVQVYFDKIEKHVEQHGYIETLFGRRRYLEEVSSKGRDKGYAVRSMMNMPIQGTAAEIVKLSMIELNKKMIKGEADLLLQVHDEVICEVEEGREDYWIEELRNTMENVCKLLVPLKVDVISAKSWGSKS